MFPETHAENNLVPHENIPVVTFSWDGHGNGTWCVWILWWECLPRMGNTWLLRFPQLEVQTHSFLLLRVPNHKAMGKWRAYIFLNDTECFFKAMELESWWSRDVKGERTCLCSLLLGLLRWQGEDLVSSPYSKKSLWFLWSPTKMCK